MSIRALLIEVRFVDGRYHGNDDWPPSPFRLFQTLVAGAYGGRWVNEPSEEKDAAFRWLECLDPPHIVAPPARNGARVALYVPNNDLDAYGGDPQRIGDVRVKKRLIPGLFDQDSPIVYAWPYNEGEEWAANISALAGRMHTLGLGLDAAYARAETVSWNQAEARFYEHSGRVARPGGGAARGATCPTAGSLESLKQRHFAAARRFRREGNEILFANTPKPRFRQVTYDGSPTLLLFDLVDGEGRPSHWRLDRIAALTERLRDAAAQRLKDASPDNAALIDNVIVGRRDSNEADKAARVRITPLPSIGRHYADRAVRRVLVEAPPNCPLRIDDLEWAFSGLPVVSDDGEILCELAAGSERGMLAHYGAEDSMSERLWRTVTAMALPLEAARRRIEPERVRERIEQKDGPERAEEERRAAAAVRQALRHAGVRGDVETIRVQREPFEAKGARAEVFAAPPRFIKERLWHAEIAFVEAFPGPLVLGDGRYLGLGLMAPAKAKFRDTAVFVVPPEAHIAVADRPAFLRAVRRAEMALARRGDGSVATLFSGHEQDGAKANSGRHRHVFLAAADLDRDGYLDILVAAAPWACDHSAPYERSEDADFDRVVSHLSVVRAGRLGVVTLGSPQKMEGQSALIDPSRIWESATPCHPTRHARRNEDKAAACARDVIAECVRRGFPRPEVEVLEFVAAPNSGNCAFQLRLRFAVAVEGPILIGRDSHAGGGLFEATSL